MNFLSFALEVQPPTGVLAKATSAFETVFTLSSKVIEVVTTNEILLVFFASGLIGLAVSVVRKLKRA